MFYRARPLWLLPCGLMLALDLGAVLRFWEDSQTEFVRDWPLSPFRAMAWIVLMLLLLCDRDRLQGIKLSLCLFCVAVFLAGPLLWVAKVLDW